MEVRASAKYIRTSPRKLRPIADVVRGKKVTPDKSIKVELEELLDLLKKSVGCCPRCINTDSPLAVNRVLELAKPIVKIVRKKRVLL